MSSINVISIDPAQSAKSALHPEVFERIARECRFSRDVKHYNVSAQKSINLAFGINKKVSKTKSRNLLLLRSVAGISLVASAFAQGLDFTSFSASWAMVIMGISMVFGLFSRVISIMSATFFTYVLAISGLEISLANISAAAAVLFSVTLFITGPGKFSFDNILRRSMIRYAKVSSRRKAEKLANLRLSYKAMQYV
ncbi:MAG: hypothetical protein K2N05_03090 [Muribaculaceae bacterium]|nr:hypothetical protein [Muribaculaceae bacterium]